MEDKYVKDMIAIVVDAEPLRERSSKIGVLASTDINIFRDKENEDENYRVKYGVYEFFIPKVDVGTKVLREQLHELNMDVKVDNQGRHTFFYAEQEVPILIQEW